MSKIDKTANGIHIASAIGFWPIMIVLIIIVAAIRSCTTPPVDPLDNSIMKRGYTVENLMVRDSLTNGFEVVYTTVNAVTDARFQEIRTRPHIRTSFEKLKNDAPLHFGLMLDTDIYDFAEFAKKYDSDPDIEMNSIFVCGEEKEDMYRRKSPRGDHFATLKEIYTQQGIQYLPSLEIYCSIPNARRSYKYWKCNGDYSTSLTDERYSHVERREIDNR